MQLLTFGPAKIRGPKLAISDRARLAAAMSDHAFGVSSERKAVAAPRPADRPLRILMAEDNKVNQRLGVSLLERRGHCVVAANNGMEAV
jgi:hypothetical protein